MSAIERGSAFVGNDLLLEHVRSELISLLVKIHFYTETNELEKELKKLVFQLDDIQFAFDIYKKQEQLDLEPVNISEIRDQVLHKIIKENNFKNIKLESRNRFTKPVLAHRVSITKSLESMVYSVINLNTDNSQTVDLNIIKKPESISIGVFRDNFNINSTALRQFRRNLDKTSRPSSNLSPFSNTNLFIADTLLSAMGFKLRASVKNKKRGLSTTLPISKQLRLINI